MKTIFTAANGAFTLTEDKGDVTLTISKAADVGGGEAAGVISLEGEGHVVFKGEQALQLAEAVLNSKIPSAILPEAEIVEGIVNEAVKAVE